MQSLAMLPLTNMNRLLVPLVAVAVLATVRADAAQPTPTNAAPAAKSDLFGSTIIAKGKGFEIKRSQLDDDVVRAKAQLSAAGRPVSPDQTALMEQQILDQLINVQLLKGKATDADRAAGKAAAEKRSEERRGGK